MLHLQTLKPVVDTSDVIHTSSTSTDGTKTASGSSTGKTDTLFDFESTRVRVQWTSYFTAAGKCLAVFATCHFLVSGFNGQIDQITQIRFFGVYIYKRVITEQLNERRRLKLKRQMNRLIKAMPN